MKRHLFYTFLGIFIATSAVTLLGVLGVVTIAKEHLDKLVLAFLVQLAFAIISLFRKADFFPPDLVVKEVKGSHVGLAIETGEVPLGFRDHPYQSGDVHFAQPFSEIPKVFVGECSDGNWVFVKLDGKSAKGFRWAARPLESKPLVYETKLQWVAIGVRKEENAKNP